MSTLPLRGNSFGGNTKENQRPKNSKAGNSKRHVLGNVTNQVRVQPVRAAKDKHSVLQGSSKPGLVDQENVCPPEGLKKSAGPAIFSIFQDEPEPAPAHARVSLQRNEEEPMQDQENLIPGHNLVLNDALVQVHQPAPPRHVAPLVPLLNIAEPMALDISRDKDLTTSRPDEFGLDPYFEDIYNYLRITEITSRPSPQYMDRQTDVTTSMRNILVDWLVEVGEEYKLHRETLFLAISYIDRFLSLVRVHRPKLQLVGAASMFIAAKYEEIYPPDVSEFVYITDDTYTRSQVLKMESVILKLLDFRVAVPTINWFCERFMELLDMKEETKFLTFYLTELSLIEVEEFLNFPPSVIAASAITLARSSSGERNAWPQVTEMMSGYSIPELEECVSCLFNLYTRARTMPQQAVNEKYKLEKFGRVALLSPPAVLAIH